MKLKEKFLADIRVFKAPELAKQILKSHQLSELVKLALEKDALLSSRAMWVLTHCSDIDPTCVKPYYASLILNLKNKSLHNGVIRGTLRLFQEQDVPTEHQSFLLDKCYEYVKNPAEAIAIRSFAITVIYQISKSYPELLNELKLLLLHLNTNDTSPGMTSRIKNTLKLIERNKRNIK
jgi:hypothetical protein